MAVCVKDGSGVKSQRFFHPSRLQEIELENIQLITLWIALLKYLGSQCWVNLVLCEIDDHGIWAQSFLFHVHEDLIEGMLGIASDVL